jgi:hypothetical protein
MIPSTEYYLHDVIDLVEVGDDDNARKRRVAVTLQLIVGGKTLVHRFEVDWERGEYYPEGAAFDGDKIWVGGPSKMLRRFKVNDPRTGELLIKRTFIEDDKVPQPFPSPPEWIKGHKWPDGQG